jgi:hypothetical protein
MWGALRKVVAVACILLSERDEKEKKKSIKKLVMDLWDKVDSTPELEHDRGSDCRLAERDRRGEYKRILREFEPLKKNNVRDLQKELVENPVVRRPLPDDRIIVYPLMYALKIYDEKKCPLANHIKRKLLSTYFS